MTVSSRRRHCALLALGLMGWTASSGCGLDCGNPSLSNGHYAIFANVLEYEGTNLENFPSARTPANGWSEWSIEWSPEQVGVVTV